MKGSVILAAVIFVSGLAFAQSETETNQPEVKEVPVAASHGKKVSKLAKETPGGPEKGKIISSAAREKSVQHNSGNHSNNGKKPGTAVNRGGNGKGNSNSIKPSLPPNAKAKPGGN